MEIDFIIVLESRVRVSALNIDEGRGVVKGIFSTRFPDFRILEVKEDEKK